jgi:tetratricopeptide (TPR) repeat protein
MKMMEDIFSQITQEFSNYMEEYERLAKEQRLTKARELLEKIRHSSESIFDPEQRGILFSFACSLGDRIFDVSGRYPRVRLLDPVKAPGNGVRSSDTRDIFLAPPLPLYGLVGRDDLIKQLKTHLFQKQFVALHGLPGAGKSALAASLAHDHEVRTYFPDGVLWVSLGREPKVDVLLGHWRFALGLPPAEMATLTLEEQARRIHAAISMRRLLLVIDDVWDLKDANTFKLGGASCAHLLTTRNRDVAERFANIVIDVPELSTTDGLVLLHKIAPRAVEVKPEDSRKLVHVVGGLPLALILVGSYLKREANSGQSGRLHRGFLSLLSLHERMSLTQDQSPLERQPSLPADVPISLNNVIGVSYDILDETSQAALQALSTFPPKPNSFSEEAALEIAQVSIQTIEELTDYGLLESPEDGRYTLHHTIADYAKMKLGGHAADNKIVSRRMASYFAHYVEVHQEDDGRFEREVANIDIALRIAHSEKMHRELIRLVNAYYPFLAKMELYTAAVEFLWWALEAARESSPSDQIQVLLNLGRSVVKSEYRKYYQPAQEAIKNSLHLAQESGVPETISNLYLVMGALATLRGIEIKEQRDTAKAEECFQYAEDYFRTILNDYTDRIKQQDTAKIIRAKVHINLGEIGLRRGKNDYAEGYLEQAINAAQEIGDRDLICAALYHQGLNYLDWAKLDSGKWDKASLFFRKCLAKALERKEEPIQKYQAKALFGLAKISAAEKLNDEACRLGQESMKIFRQINHPEADEVKMWLVERGYISEYTKGHKE